MGGEGSGKDGRMWAGWWGEGWRPAEPGTPRHPSLATLKLLGTRVEVG